MELAGALATITKAQRWAYFRTVAIRTGPGLGVPPVASNALANVLHVITRPDSTIDDIEGQLARFRNVTTGIASEKTRQWAVMLTAAAAGTIGHDNMGDGLVVASAMYLVGLEEPEELQWTTFMTVAGIDKTDETIWVSLAGDWTGTPTELTDACRAAST